MNKKSNALVITLLIIVVILLVYIAFIKNSGPSIKESDYNNSFVDNNKVFQDTKNTKEVEIKQPQSKTVNIKLTSFNYGDNNKTFYVNKGDLIVVDSDTYTDGGYTAEDIVYDKTMLRLESQESPNVCPPEYVGCSSPDIFKFIPIKSGTTVIKRSHFQGFNTERINLSVTLKIN